MTCGICGKYASARMEVKAGVVVGCACCYRAYNSLTVRESLQEPAPRIPVLRLDEAAADGWAEDWRDFATRLARVEAGR